MAKENYTQIDSLMSDGDRQIFCTYVPEGTLENMIERTARGWECLKKYKLKENPNDVEKAKKRLTM